MVRRFGADAAGMSTGAGGLAPCTPGRLVVIPCVTNKGAGPSGSHRPPPQQVAEESRARFVKSPSGSWAVVGRRSSVRHAPQRAAARRFDGAAARRAVESLFVTVDLHRGWAGVAHPPSTE